jgi:hypothetical protein
VRVGDEDTAHDRGEADVLRRRKVELTRGKREQQAMILVMA